MKVFVTGGNGGIGRSIVKKLITEGIEVINPSSEELDLSSKFNVAELKVDGLVHCAGINTPKPYSEVNLEELNNIFQINTFSFLELVRQLDFSIGSNIVAIGSLYSTYTREHRIEYAMSKHALFAAVKTLAIEKSINKIPVNLISPGFVDTPLTRKNLDINRLLIKIKMK